MQGHNRYSGRAQLASSEKTGGSAGVLFHYAFFAQCSLIGLRFFKNNKMQHIRVLRTFLCVRKLQVCG